MLGCQTEEQKFKSQDSKSRAEDTRHRIFLCANVSHRWKSEHWIIGLDIFVLTVVIS
jgi:hypothetical protein